MMAAQGSTRSFLPWLLYFLLCLLFQVMKTERRTETLSCCFPDPDDLFKPPPPLLPQPPPHPRLLEPEVNFDETL